MPHSQLAGSSQCHCQSKPCGSEQCGSEQCRCNPASPCECRRRLLMLPADNGGRTVRGGPTETFVEDVVEGITKADADRDESWQLRTARLHEDARGRCCLEASLQQAVAAGREAADPSQSAGHRCTVQAKAA